MQKKNIIQNLLLFLTAGLIFHVSIMSYGLGITDDSVNYLSAASSFPSMMKIDKSPFVEWPPLYPAILSLYKLTGMNILNFAAALHGLSFCLSIVIFNAMTKTYFHNKHIYWIYIICILFSIPLLQSFIFLWSEGIFILLILITIYYLDIYIKKPSIQNFALLIMVSILMCMQRKSGIMITGAFAFILYKYRDESKSGFLKALSYLVISSAPFILWTYRRYLINGSATNAASFRPGMIWQNFSQSVDVISSWLMPNEIPLIARSIILIIGMIPAVFIFRKYFSESYDDNKKNIVFSLITFVIYSFTLCIIFLYLKADEPIDDRILSPVYLFFVFLFFIFLDRLLVFVRQNNVLKKIIVASVILLPLYFILRAGHHIRGWNENGTGGYNTKGWIENKLVRKLISIEPQNIVTNNIYAVGYYLNFINDSKAQVFDTKSKLSGTHFIIAYFSDELTHVAARIENITADKSGGIILYQGKDGIIIQK